VVGLLRKDHLDEAHLRDDPGFDALHGWRVRPLTVALSMSGS
jgi:hypothetical protein